MVDEIKKDIIPDPKENKENLGEDLDFSDELSELENQIRNVAWDKIREREREQKIVSETSDELDTLGAEVGLVWLDKKVNEKWKDKVSEFFWKWKEELNKLNPNTKKQIKKTSLWIKGKLYNRPQEVRQAIEKSADNILDEIYNWKEEKNPVARSLLRIANWIMKTEK